MIGEKQVVNDFRRILKHFSKLPSFKTKASPLRLQVLQQYKDGRAEHNTDRINELRNRAHMYAEMVTDIKTLQYLRSLDSGERLDPREKIRATARRVGLAVPTFSDEAEKLFANEKKE